MQWCASGGARPKQFSSLTPAKLESLTTLNSPDATERGAPLSVVSVPSAASVVRPRRPGQVRPDAGRGASGFGLREREGENLSGERIRGNYLRGIGDFVGQEAGEASGEDGFQGV